MANCTDWKTAKPTVEGSPDNMASAYIASANTNHSATLTGDEMQSEYKPTPLELTRIMLGERFTLGNGQIVNATYQAWITNLNNMHRAGCICSSIRIGVKELNLYHRSAENDGTSDSNQNGSCTTGQCPPEYFYPPYVI